MVLLPARANSSFKPEGWNESISGMRFHTRRPAARRWQFASCVMYQPISYRMVPISTPRILPPDLFGQVRHLKISSIGYPAAISDGIADEYLCASRYKYT